MSSIQSSSRPLVFRVDKATQLRCTPHETAPITLRTVARALEGMQKEAIVCGGAARHAWRMVCDEGPYLNGTDLAPFPLAFFTAGMAATFMEELQALAHQRGIKLGSFELVQDNRYVMEGSSVRGTMTGSALPVDVDVRIETDAGKDVINDLVLAAVAASPVSGLLREILDSRFSVSHNGVKIAPQRVASLGDVTADDPRDVLDGARPASGDAVAADIITKVKSAETLFGVEGGAASSLAAEQKRELHVRGSCRVRSDGLKEIRTQLLKPIGSVFRFLSDASVQFGGQGRAPSGLDYLAAGIAFCYMTQLGRYSAIVKKPLDGYCIVQDTGFSLPGASGATGQAGTANPVDTHVFIDSGEDDDYARLLVDMGEQTCFLHAACRSQVKSRIRLV